MPKYQARLLNKAGVTVQVLDRHAGMEFGTITNDVGSASITVPKGDEKLSGALLRNYLDIHREDDTGFQQVSRTIITERALEADTATLTGMTEDVILGWLRTPTSYGMVLQHEALTGGVNGLAAFLARGGFHTLRAAGALAWVDADWSSDPVINRVTSATNVDRETEPSLVLLAQDGTPAFVPSGSITLEFRSSEVLDFLEWDRIRWDSTYDSDGVARTRARARFSNDGSAWTSWTAWVDGVQPAQQGWPVSSLRTLPAEGGITPSTAARVQVEVELTTTDTTSGRAEDGSIPEGVTLGVTPVVSMVEVIARAGETLSVNPQGSDAVSVGGLPGDAASFLEVLQEACGQTSQEFRLLNGVLTIADEVGTDRSDSLALMTGPE